MEIQAATKATLSVLFCLQFILQLQKVKNRNTGSNQSHLVCSVLSSIHSSASESKKWKYGQQPKPGYNDNLSTRYSTQGPSINLDSRADFDSASFMPRDQLISNSHEAQSTRNENSAVGLGIGPSHSSAPGFQTFNSSVQPSNLNPFEDWSQYRDFFSEEDIRMKSHEILENEDMQQLLRVFSMGGHGINVADDGYAFSSYMPSTMPNFDEDRSRSGKAVVGWLKIKAAMRWGFFIRKKAAERRAQIVELDEE